MNRIRIFFKNFAAGRKELFARIGVFIGTALAVTQIVEYVLNIPALESLTKSVSVGSTDLFAILSEPLVYLGTALVLALLAQTGFARYSRKFKDSDFRISITMGDIFDCDGTIIIPSNNLFSSDLRMLGDRNSIHKQLIQRNRMPKGSQLSSAEDIERQTRERLAEERYTAYVADREPYVFGGESYTAYEYGTLLPIEVNVDRKERNVMLFSMSEFLSPGIPSVRNEDLFLYIDRMWDFIETNGIADRKLVIPLIGTGAAGVGKRKQVVARYIMNTYITRARRLRINELTVSIFPGDYLSGEINLAELKEYADSLIKFPDWEFGESNAPTAGKK